MNAACNQRGRGKVNKPGSQVLAWQGIADLFMTGYVHLKIGLLNGTGRGLFELVQTSSLGVFFFGFLTFLSLFGLRTFHRQMDTVTWTSSNGQITGEQITGETWRENACQIS